jgi:hypoxanthine phosphoribosyltransferase
VSSQGAGQIKTAVMGGTLRAAIDYVSSQGAGQIKTAVMGGTLRAAIDYVSSQGAGQIKTAVMQHKTSSALVPDFYADRISEWRWIIYPWAAHEDVLGFTEKALSSQPATMEQIGKTLQERYSLSVERETLREILDELVDMNKAIREREKYKRI